MMSPLEDIDWNICGIIGDAKSLLHSIALDFVQIHKLIFCVHILELVPLILMGQSLSHLLQNVCL